MMDPLVPIKMALAQCSEDELFALIDAGNVSPKVAPGLLAWLEAAAYWEWHRRTAQEYALRPPEAAIPPEEDAVSITTVAALRAAFAKDSTPVWALFTELEKVLTRKGQRQ